MKKSFNKGAVLSFILLAISGLNSVLSILLIATLWVSLNAYLEIKKTGERGKILSLFVIFISLFGTVFFLIGMFQGSKDDASILFFIAIASLIVGMILSNAVKTKRIPNDVKMS